MSDHIDAPKSPLPMCVRGPYGEFELQSLEEVAAYGHPGPQRRYAIRVVVRGSSYCQFSAPLPDLLAFADLIYRCAGQVPRDVAGAGEPQTVRLEVVHVPPAPPAPLEQLAAPANGGEVEQIKLRMLRGG